MLLQFIQVVHLCLLQFSVSSGQTTSRLFGDHTCDKINVSFSNSRRLVVSHNKLTRDIKHDRVTSTLCATDIHPEINDYQICSPNLDTHTLMLT